MREADPHRNRERGAARAVARAKAPEHGMAAAAAAWSREIAKEYTKKQIVDMDLSLLIRTTSSTGMSASARVKMEGGVIP